MSKLTDRTLTIERIFNAPLPVVWDAWTQSDHIVRWWAPKGMDVQVITHDFRPGGTWKYAMVMPDGNAFLSEGVYQEIVQHEKIVSSADFKPMTEGVELHTYFAADGAKTKFTFQVSHPTPEYCQQQKEMGFYKGWGSALDRLAATLG